MEIIPNWHPIFVHFSVALLASAAILHMAVLMIKNESYKQQITIVARWNLWLGTFVSILTVIAGWIAFNSVNHDNISHLAMLEHRNWAITTFVLFVLVCAWSLYTAKKSVPIDVKIVVILFIAGGMLASTAWHGAELVYRHGLGVMSLPKSDPHQHSGHDDHEHSHGGEDNRSDAKNQGETGMSADLHKPESQSLAQPQSGEQGNGNQQSASGKKDHSSDHHDHNDHEH